MKNTSDIIELFLKELIASQNGELELKRNELAGQFNCAPSQINYVLSTRFTVNHGYMVTSRKGGGGYIRITSIDMARNDYILHIMNQVGELLGEGEASHVIRGLYERKIITLREAKLMLAALKDELLGYSLEEACRRRAQVLRSMMVELIEA